MRYLVRARVKSGQEAALLRAIEAGTLGHGSVAGGEYLRNMTAARLCDDGTARWVEVCFCATPLAEERPYWEQYFDLEKVQDAHPRSRCRDESGEDPWACGDCDCTAKLEERLGTWGRPFLEVLREAVKPFSGIVHPSRTGDDVTSGSWEESAGRSDHRSEL
jgi:hypothetical protein